MDLLNGWLVGWRVGRLRGEDKEVEVEVDRGEVIASCLVAIVDSKSSAFILFFYLSLRAIPDLPSALQTAT